MHVSTVLLYKKYRYVYISNVLISYIVLMYRPILHKVKIEPEHHGARYSDLLKSAFLCFQKFKAKISTCRLCRFL